MTDDHRFQVHLGGIIDLLSNHLYSSPSVYVRELLQNATDAIRARQHLDAEHVGQVTMHTRRDDRGRVVLTITDDGIGLTEDEVHGFLATIGASSKREIDERRADFIGQFGIGLLSCFVVSDDIDVVTRSAKGGPTILWRGAKDGAYTIERREDDAPIGTTVHLVAKAGMEEWFDGERLSELALRFGALLPFPVSVDSGQGPQVINPEPPPWRCTYDSPADARQAALAFGEQMLGGQFLDVVPIHSDAGSIAGFAYVLPYSPNPTTPPAHRVYLKGMLLSDKAENLLPRWAFFVTCILDVQSLRPTASRERFYEDEDLQSARDALGDALRTHLIWLKQHDPTRLKVLIGVHYRAIKALAAYDTEFLRLFADVLPFETSLGRMSFGSLRDRVGDGVLRYAPTVDLFRQISQVASAQGIIVVNAGYSFDSEILERVGEVTDMKVERIDAEDMAGALEDADEAMLGQILPVARAALADFECGVAAKRFSPAELPVLYVTGEDAAFARTIEATQEAAGDSLWGDMVGALQPQQAQAVLMFNADSPLMARLSRVEDEDALRLTVQMLYVQALLLGHHPLKAEEMALLNVGLIELIERGVMPGRMLQ